MELQEGTEIFWSTVDHIKCTKYIDHIQKVLPIIVERGGKESGH